MAGLVMHTAGRDPRLSAGPLATRQLKQAIDLFRNCKGSSTQLNISRMTLKKPSWLTRHDNHSIGPGRRGVRERHDQPGTDCDRHPH